MLTAAIYVLSGEGEPAEKDEKEVGGRGHHGRRRWGEGGRGETKANNNKSEMQRGLALPAFEAPISKPFVSHSFQDILTPLTALFNRYFSDPATDLKDPEPRPKSKDAKKKTEPKADELDLMDGEMEEDKMEEENNGAAEEDGGEEEEESNSELFVFAVNLLWNLCEASETALAVANKENLIPLLLKHLQYQVSEEATPNPRVKVALLQCLYSATEDNSVASAAVAQCLPLLQSIFTSEASAAEPTHARVLAVGVVLNAAASCSEPLSESLWPVIVQVLHSVLEQDQRAAAAQFAAAAAAGGEAKALTEQRHQLGDLLQGQQAALEILTNLCCPDDKDDRWEDEDDDDELVDDSSSSGGSMSMYDQTSSSVLAALPPFLADALRSADVLKLVLAKANLPEEAALAHLRVVREPKLQCKQLLRQLRTLRSRSFLCVNNMVSAMAFDDEELLFETWTLLGKLCFGASEEASDFELLESATAAMRALTHRLAELKSARLAQVEASDLQGMVEFGGKLSEQPEVKANLVEIIGLVGVAVINAMKKVWS